MLHWNLFSHYVRHRMAWWTSIPLKIAKLHFERLNHFLMIFTFTLYRQPFLNLTSEYFLFSLFFFQTLTEINSHIAEAQKDGGACLPQTFSLFFVAYLVGSLCVYILHSYSIGLNLEYFLGFIFNMIYLSLKV